MITNGLTPFERRRHRIRINKRDQVQFNEDSVPELASWLRQTENDLRNKISINDPLCADFLEWYEDEYNKYGPKIRPGLAALYWSWVSGADDKKAGLDRKTYEAKLEELTRTWKGLWLDGDFCSPRTLVQEFVWWASGDWIMQRHLLEAIEEFSIYHAAGRMPDWRRRKRRRQAAQRRKAIKKQYEQQLLENEISDKDDETE